MNSEGLGGFSIPLTPWFATHRRALPWRTPRGVPRDPWQTLVSEVMSQQTRLEVVIGRYTEWMVRFPTVHHLAQAKEEEVLSAWAGLGYYSRARNLHKAAQAISRNGWPGDIPGLLALPGLGAYTAAAVGSLCMGMQVPMIDGNVQRVLSRWHALAQDPRSGAGARRIQELAHEGIQGGDAGEINEATMELGALVCKPRSPDCANCPLAENCRACALGEPEAYPPPRSRTETVAIHRKVIVAQLDGKILLRKAGTEELLSGLWILPAQGDHDALVGNGAHWGVVRHAITHHKVVWEVTSGDWKGKALPTGWAWILRKDLDRVVVSSLLRKALEKAGI